MSIRKSFFICIFAVTIQVFLAAQTHLSVPLGHPVYHAIEQAQMRGLLRHLPGARPYSRAQILSFITEILNSDENRRFGGLTREERRILEQFRQDLSPDRDGLDLIRGTVSGERTYNDIYFSWELGFGFDAEFGVGVFPIAGGYRQSADSAQGFERANHPGSGDVFTAIDIGALNLSFMGDIGRNASYGFSLSGRVFRNPRSVLGTHNSMWRQDYRDSGPQHSLYRDIVIFSEPHAHFPFSHRKRWDGFVWAATNVNNRGQLAWPESVSIGYKMMPEFASSFFAGHVFFRVARLEREWAAMTPNGSLVLNQSAQPFLGMELTITPFDWIAISSLTGRLEYHNSFGINPGRPNNAEITAAAGEFQNSFSIVMAELNWRYFHAGIGSSVVWPTRLEWGYLFPFADNFLYQNNIGDFDNLALFLNLQGRYPGLGKLWFSLFLDEMDFARPFFEKSRMMFAFQLGASAHVPIRRLPFSTITISYTKIEPFNYTHPRITTPWHGDTLMQQNFVNFGRPLGSYLPPNSDEILVRFESLPSPHSRVRLQYQLIRHGATFGDRAVIGSSIWSELHPGTNIRHAQRKFFLRDGAYQWMHIVRLRGDYCFTGSNLPIRAFAEIGGVYSFFTDIRGEPNSGRAYSFRRIDTPQYPRTLRFIANVGIQIFPN